MYDLRECVLRISTKIVDQNGEKPEKEDELSIANMPLTSLFSSYELLMNDIRVAFTEKFNYKSYMQVLCSYNTNTQRTSLSSKGFYRGKAIFFYFMYIL